MPIVITTSTGTPASIVDYQSLKTAVADELNRDDKDSLLANWIVMGESRLNRDLRMLDMIQTETGTLSTAARTMALPTLYQDKIQFRINDPLRELIWVPPSRLMKYAPEVDTGGTPRYYTVTSTFEFDRVPDSAYSYTLKYYKGYRLSASSDTNYLLTNYPQAYLYAACLYGAIYMRDSEHAQTLNGLLISELRDIKRAEARRKGTDDARLVTELNTRQTYSIDNE